MRLHTRFQLAAVVAALTLLAPVAQAVPSFARQTGMACAACHTVFPELTPFGRQFKANGYVLDNLRQVRAVSSARQQLLSLSEIPDLSAMVQLNYSQVAKRVPTQSGPALAGTSEFPRQLSLFYAGKIAPHLGTLAQITYTSFQNDFNMDNTDVRFANLVVLPGKNTLTYGLDLNNNPTVQDLWNDTPAWGFPWSHANASLSPVADVQLDEQQAQNVAGLTVYGFYDESLYVEFGGYHYAPLGPSRTDGLIDANNSNVLHGFSPYWRVAYEYDWDANSLEVGTVGEDFEEYPGGGTALVGRKNTYLDIGEDFQYQYIGEHNIFSLLGSHIHENITWGASYPDVASNPRDNLTVTRLTGSYYYQREYGVQLGWFDTTGSTDRGAYPPTTCAAGDQQSYCGVVTSANGSPDTNGFIAQLDYVPWYNVKLVAQYTAYNKFNGAGTNYDGFGRNASDNDVFNVMLWYAF